MLEVKEITKDGWVLMYANGTPVRSGEESQDFRGDWSTITGGRPPHKPSSEGFVWTSDNRELYPSVFNLKWVRTNNVTKGTK